MERYLRWSDIPLSFGNLTDDTYDDEHNSAHAGDLSTENQRALTPQVLQNMPQLSNL
jgi:hypothetical protein